MFYSFVPHAQRSLVIAHLHILGQSDLHDLHPVHCNTILLYLVLQPCLQLDPNL